MMCYIFSCPACNATTEEYRRVDERNDPVHCPRCHTLMERQFTPIAAVQGYYRSFADENGGKGRYFSNLATFQPYGREDPKAFFRTQAEAENAGKAQADRLKIDFITAK